MQGDLFLYNLWPLNVAGSDGVVGFGQYKYWLEGKEMYNDYSYMDFGLEITTIMIQMTAYPLVKLGA